MTLFGNASAEHPAFTWLRIPMRNGARLPPSSSAARVSSPNSSNTAVRCGEESIRGAPGAAPEFWQRLQTLGRCQRPSSFAKSALAKTVPLGLHGDAGPFTKQDSAFVISWNSLLGGCREQRFRTEVALHSDSQERLDG